MLRIYESFSHLITQEVTDLFVLYSRTGFHYQDLMQILRKPDAYIITGIDGRQWISKPRQRTGVDAKLPIEKFKEIKEIVDKYGGWEKLPTYDCIMS